MQLPRREMSLQPSQRTAYACEGNPHTTRANVTLLRAREWGRDSHTRPQIPSPQAVHALTQLPSAGRPGLQLPAARGGAGSGRRGGDPAPACPCRAGPGRCRGRRWPGPTRR